jgi:type I restriction enzyme M protein
MALKKSELYSSLWQSCDELRGGMDASQYKDYVLVLLSTNTTGRDERSGLSNPFRARRGFRPDAYPGWRGASRRLTLG